MTFHTAVLSNGLTVVAECNPSSYSVALGFFVRAGSRDETPEIGGVSHFLEHLAFKGSQHLTAEQINRAFDDIGANSNAFTSEEMTVYFASLLPELQSEAVSLLAELLQPAFRTDDFEMEKQVILEEIRMYDEQPPFGADDIIRELFFAGHPLGQSVLGTAESITALTPEQMRLYFSSRYSPENIVLAGCGKIDFDSFVRQAETVTSRWTATSPTSQTSQWNTNPVSPYIRQRKKIRGSRGTKVVVRPDATQQYILQAVDGPDVDSPDRFAVAVMTNILGDDIGSRLYWKLVDTGKVDTVGLSSLEYMENGMLLTGMSCSPEMAKENMAAIAKIYETAAKDGVTEQELIRAKNKIQARLVLGSERPRGRLFGVGSEWLTSGVYRTLRDDLNDIAAVTLEDIHTMMAKYPLTHPLTVVVGPLTTW